MRVASAAIMAPAAIGFAYLGGWWFLLFWTAAGLAVFWEWMHLVSAHGEARNGFLAGAVGLGIGALAYGCGYPLAAFLSLLATGLAVAALASAPQRGWAAAGVLYAAVLVFAPAMLRADPAYGLSVIFLLFAIVWATDIAAYFGGRAIRGAKLWPSVSPNKTWSGAVTGAAAAMIAGVAVAWLAGGGSLVWIAAASVLLSVCAQAGDLFESALKRRFGAKDSGQLIPGHGGLMDRLDGFVIAALVALMIGAARGGFESPAAGLVIW